MSRSNKSRYGRSCKHTKAWVGRSRRALRTAGHLKRLEVRAQRRATSRVLSHVVETQLDAAEHVQALLYED